MKLLNQLIVIGFFLLFSAFSFAQNNEGNPRKVFGKTIRNIHERTGAVKCISAEYEEILQDMYPERASNAEFEEWISPKVEAIKKRMLTARNSNSVITIPVVVHVIHNGDPVGMNENISDARVLSQITVLNQDFRRILGTPGHNTNAVGADVEIEFCMAQRKPDGTPTNGINRVNLGVASWQTFADVNWNLKPSTIWDPTQYLNIWVAQFSPNPNHELSSILGYAQFPDSSNLEGLEEFGGWHEEDGVVIEYHCFGTSDIVGGSFFTTFDKGRTTTHEVGHFLGLRHIWGDFGSRRLGIVDCDGTDFCDDTPIAGWDNSDCNFAYDSCPEPGLDMVENYMDYTDDVCMNVFTLDQKARMLAVMENSPRRNTLATSLACQSVLDTQSFNELELVSVYPNPATDLLNITLSDNNNLPERYTIFNSLGQTVASSSIHSISDLSINTGSLGLGIYFIRIEKGNASKTLKFLKK